MRGPLVASRHQRVTVEDASLIVQVRSWASLLASESRDPTWIRDGYVMPDTVARLLAHLRTVHGSVVGLVGFQGVGKSSALLALSTGLREHKDKSASGLDTVLFKWRRSSELFKTLLGIDHEASVQFLTEYYPKIRPREETNRSLPTIWAATLSKIRQQTQALLDEQPWLANFDYEESKRSKTEVERFRREAWIEMLKRKHTIFVDMPDYSKTDRRLMAKDLEEIYWLWNTLNRTNTPDRPNLVIAIQHEMFRGHFFFDKMQKVELQPMQPDRMVEAYRLHFKAAAPFTEDALLTLARMSRGIFRRFLRYITLALDLWEMKQEKEGSLIDVATVKEAVATERLAEDMELELSDLFPKHSEPRTLAVKLLMLLEEQGPQKQGQLATLLDIEPYSLSRLLTKLEAARYVTRTREGTDKFVAIRSATRT